MPRLSPGVGGSDFPNATGSTPTGRVLWTAQALPSVTPLTDLPESLAAPDLRLPPTPLASALPSSPGDFFADHRGDHHRLEVLCPIRGQYAVLLPLDRVFDLRAAAALRLWRSLTARSAGPPVGMLTGQMIDRLVLALRALDGRLDGATRYDIAAALFDLSVITKRDWIDHDLRDRTARLIRLGLALMNGGYRQLLLYPYRRKVRRHSDD